jgi:hypothetical protein
MKVSIFIEKDQFQDFFKWVNQINIGIIASTDIVYSHSSDNFEQPLQLFLEPEAYNLIEDARMDLAEMEKAYGKFDLEFEPLTHTWETRVIRDVVRNSSRHNKQTETIHAALQIISEMPGITPGEAMIIAERQVFGNI